MFAIWTSPHTSRLLQVEKKYIVRFHPTILSVLWGNLQLLVPIYLWLRNYPKAFGKKMVDLFRGLVADKKGMPPLPNKSPSIEKMFASMEFSDLWGEAHMTGVCHYLRSGKYLVIPDSFKDLIPKKL